MIIDPRKSDFTDVIRQTRA